MHRYAARTYFINIVRCLVNQCGGRPASVVSPPSSTTPQYLRESPISAHHIPSTIGQTDINNIDEKALAKQCIIVLLLVRQNMRNGGFICGHTSETDTEEIGQRQRWAKWWIDLRCQPFVISTNLARQSLWKRNASHSHYQQSWSLFPKKKLKLQGPEFINTLRNYRFGPASLASSHVQ